MDPGRRQLEEPSLAGIAVMVITSLDESGRGPALDDVYGLFDVFRAAELARIWESSQGRGERSPARLGVEPMRGAWFEEGLAD